jgi:hypothetical protein
MQQAWVAQLLAEGDGWALQQAAQDTGRGKASANAARVAAASDVRVTVMRAMENTRR